MNDVQNLAEEWIQTRKKEVRELCEQQFLKGNLINCPAEWNDRIICETCIGFNGNEEQVKEIIKLYHVFCYLFAKNDIDILKSESVNYKIINKDTVYHMQQKNNGLISHDLVALKVF